MSAIDTKLESYLQIQDGEIILPLVGGLTFAIGQQAAKNLVVALQGALERIEKRDWIMQTNVVNTKKVVPVSILPDGEYYGTWSGYKAEVEIAGEHYEIKTENGMRGTVPCIVHIKDGNCVTVIPMRIKDD